MIVIFRAFHVDIWVAFVGFFFRSLWRSQAATPPLCVSGNAGLRWAWVDHLPFFGGYTAVGYSGDGGDGDFWMHLPIAVTVTLIPCMTVMTMVTMFWDTPSRELNRHAAVLLSEAARRRIAGRKTSIRESKGTSGARLFQGKVSCVYTL